MSVDIDVSEPPAASDYPSHNLEAIACDPADHVLEDGPVKFTKVCSECGLGLGTLVDHLDHDPREVRL